MKESNSFWDNVKTKIPLSVPNLSDDTIENIKECIETGWITRGRFVNKFENMLAAYTKLEKVVTVQSGTAGLHEAYRLLGVGDGDEVIVPNITFISTVNTAVYLRAHPIFMDCDESLNMDLDKLEEFLENECETNRRGTYNKKTGRRIRVVTVVHLFGNLIDMKRVMNIASKYKLKVLEDAAQAMGSFYTKGKYKGMHAGTVGHMGVISFNANKIITAVGGGVILSQDSTLLNKAKSLAAVAKTPSPYIYHDEVGYNYGLSNIQGVFGISQLEKLEKFIEAKIQNYNLYKKLLKGIEGIELLPFNEGTRSNHWFYTILVNEDKYGISRNELFENLVKEGIQASPVWALMSEQKPFKNFQNYKIEKSKSYVEKALNMPCSTNIQIKEIEYYGKECGSCGKDCYDIVSSCNFHPKERKGCCDVEYDNDDGWVYHWYFIRKRLGTSRNVLVDCVLVVWSMIVVNRSVQAMHGSTEATVIGTSANSCPRNMKSSA